MTVINSFLSTRWDKLGKLGGKATIANALISSGAELATRNKEAGFFEKVCSNLNVGADLLAAGLTFFCAGNPYVLGGVAAFYIGRALIRPVMTALSGGSLTDIGVDVGRGAMDVALNFSALKVGKLFSALSKANTAIVPRAAAAVENLLVKTGASTPEALAKLTKTVDILTDEATTASKMLKGAEKSLASANTGLKSNFKATLKDLKENHPELYGKYKVVAGASRKYHKTKQAHEASTAAFREALKNRTTISNEAFEQSKQAVFRSGQALDRSEQALVKSGQALGKQRTMPEAANTLRSVIVTERKILQPLVAEARIAKEAAEEALKNATQDAVLQKAVTDTTKAFTDLQATAKLLRTKSIALGKGTRKIRFAQKDIADFTKWNTDRQGALKNAQDALAKASLPNATITEEIVNLQSSALGNTLRVDKRRLFKDTMEVGFGKEQAAALGHMAQRSKAIPTIVTKKAESFLDRALERTLAAREKVAKAAAAKAAQTPVPGHTYSNGGILIPSWSA